MCFVRVRGLGLIAALTPFLSGCSGNSVALLDPGGTVALAERNLMLTAAALMLIVVVPVWLLTYAFVRRYRADRARGRYTPEWSYSPRLDAIIWLVPAVIVAVLGYLVWTGTHRLDPYRPLDMTTPPLEVDVIAQDWRWLFIYPGQDIATINELVFPADRPIRLTLTSDTVMNAFFVPRLGSQIYAMAGMKTTLNLQTKEPATFVGRNMQYSGKGFADQHFRVRAARPENFDEWVRHVREAGKPLDISAYKALAGKRRAMPVTYYSSVARDLFDDIVARYHHPPSAKASSSAHTEKAR